MPSGSLAMRDIGLLQSALAMPQSGMGGEYFHTDIFEMAAAYLFHIVKNHPFVDGNKRTGAMAAYSFLMMNSVDLDAPEAEFQALVLATAEGAAIKAQIAEFLRRYSRSGR